MCSRVHLRVFGEEMSIQILWPYLKKKKKEAMKVNALETNGNMESHSKEIENINKSGKFINEEYSHGKIKNSVDGAPGWLSH